MKIPKSLLAALGPTVTMAQQVSVSLTPNAIEQLQAHDLWTPNMTAFANGEPNVEGFNFTAENEKLAASSLNTTDLIVFGPPDDGTGVHTYLGGVGCEQCDVCWKACFALLWAGPFYFICFGACKAQDYCKEC